jgi:DNA-binding PadR family transcriptional regulator
MSATRLLILGVLHFKQPTYGYEVRRELESWHADQWANIAYGSIYHALKKMAEEGLIESVGEEIVGNRPARIGYVITSVGEDMFRHLLREYWWEVKPVIDPFMVAVAFMPFLSSEEITAALRTRITALQAMIEAIEFQANQPADEFRPPHVADLMRRMAGRARADIEWSNEVREKVEAGKLPFGESEFWAQRRGDHQENCTTIDK